MFVGAVAFLLAVVSVYFATRIYNTLDVETKREVNKTLKGLLITGSILSTILILITIFS